MKIGILTHNPKNNYGGILQAYALQVVLKQLGHEPELLAQNFPFKIGYKGRVKLLIKWFVYRFVKHRKGLKLLTESSLKKIFYPTVEKHTRGFVAEYVKMRYIDSIQEVQPTDYQALIVGSDQIWRPIWPVYRPRFAQTVFLEFAKGWNVKRLAYAASFGVEEWEYSPEDTEACQALAPLFDAISVRERGGVALCKKYLGVDAVHVLDPTLLLNATDYIKLFETKKVPKSAGNLFCYILDKTDDKTHLIDIIEKEKGLDPFTIGISTDYCRLPETQILPSVETWLRSFYDSDFIVTDSFHGCVFSIIFRKQFVVYGNYLRGMDRFNSLLSLFGLENRLITNSEQYKALQPIDYAKVEEKLRDVQQFSMDFLKDNLA